MFDLFGKRFFQVTFLIVSSSLFNSVSAQDAQFSQYYASELYLNPAFAGSENFLSATTNYRQQWSSIVTPFISGQVSLIVPFNSKKGTINHLGGMGFSVYQNRAGEGHFETIGANINFGYNLKFANLHHLIFGVQGGMVQKSVRTKDLKWGSQFNPLVGGYDQSEIVNVNTLDNRVFFPDFAAGLMYEFNPHRAYSDKGTSAWIGGSAYHISRPNESMIVGAVNRLPVTYKLYGGTEFNISQTLNISPNGFIAYQNQQLQINAGGYFSFIFTKKEHARVMPAYVSFGSWYRFDDSMIFSFALGNETYRLGFSYDLNNSSLRYNTQGKGAFEISLRIQKPTKEVITRPILI